jgi:hypothetical protein
MPAAGDLLGGDVAQRRPQLGDALAGQPVVDPCAVPAGGEKAGPCHRPEVVRRVRHGLVDLARDVLDRALALRQEVDDLGPPPAGEGLRHLGEAFVQRVLGDSVTHACIVDPSAGFVKSSNDHLTNVRTAARR